MSELLSKQEAKLAWANGKELLIKSHHWENFDDLTCDFTLQVFDLDEYEFKLKPRTITINGVEVPAPFKPEYGEKFYYVDVRCGSGFNSITYRHDYKEYIQFGAWRTEEEIKQVVSALRSVFKPQ